MVCFRQFSGQVDAGLCVRSMNISDSRSRHFADPVHYTGAQAASYNPGGPPYLDRVPVSQIYCISCMIIDAIGSLDNCQEYHYELHHRPLHHFRLHHQKVYPDVSFRYKYFFSCKALLQANPQGLCIASIHFDGYSFILDILFLFII